MTLPDFITQARARLNKATKGPLEVIRFDNEGGYISYQVETRISRKSHAILGSYSDLYNPKAKADAILAAHAPADLTAALSALEIAWGALEFYSRYIPVHRVITPESAQYEREYGIGRKATEAQAEINRLLAEEKE